LTNGVVTAEKAEQWILALEEVICTERFFHAVMWFITMGRKPAQGMPLKMASFMSCFAPAQHAMRIVPLTCHAKRSEESR
jgi:hypothetical protein